jgi:hypothetical protein
MFLIVVVAIVVVVVVVAIVAKLIIERLRSIVLVSLKLILLY